MTTLIFNIKLTGNACKRNIIKLYDGFLLKRGAAVDFLIGRCHRSFLHLNKIFTCKDITYV